MKKQLSRPAADLAGLAAFAAVADTGSFSAAARRLGVSKAAVSKRVAALEERLGARLLSRTTRRSSLTEVGMDFHERCGRILAEVDEAERAAAALHARPRGTLRLAAPMTFAVRHLAPLIPAFMARYPDLKVELALNDRMVDLVEEGFDMAVRVATLPDSSLIARLLASSRRILVASPAYWARAGRPSRPEELARHDCLLYSYLADPNAWRFGGPSGEIVVPIRGRLAANNGDALIAAAEAGLGVVQTPSFIAGEAVRSGRLAVALAAWEPPPVRIHAVFPHSRHLTAKVRLFVDFLAERFGDNPAWDRGL